MFTHIKGILKEIDLTSIVIDVNGIGFLLRISLNTYYKVKKFKEIFLYTHLIIREEGFKLYGFYNKKERSFFRHLISVNGVGVNVAMIILSSLTTSEISDAIINNKKDILKSIKGIGDKIAKRILIELKDKIQKSSLDKRKDLSLLDRNLLKNEAISALLNLGFSSKKHVIDIIDVLINKYPNISIGDLLKKSLMIL